MLRTQEQEKKICTSCPMAKTANLVGDSCTLIIIRDLLVESKRFGDFEASLTGVSTRTLTKKLTLLVDQGIVKRTKTTTKPSYIEYSLTKKGRGLSKIIKSMEEYGKQFLTT